MSDAISQKITISNGCANTIYNILTNGVQFSACTGAPAENKGEAGGTFSQFGGVINGRNVELVPGKLVVQAWRANYWDEGVYSIVRFDITSTGKDASIELTQTGYPADKKENLEAGWEQNYWKPIRNMLK